ncbi:hypothetical protein INT45_013097 [Circinella minor]|uniref:Uncharacterized protein n=1 Tax=Circinella minor TaxID=1195481 RepID=A0A8H7RTK7_9FUNG|nr:hypothetical protein INT45_013097 [Circinella minor]
MVLDIQHFHTKHRPPIDGAPAFSIKKQTKFAELESFHGASFFGLDEMHLIGANVSKRIWKMISGSFKNSTTSFELGTTKRQIIGSSVESSANTILSSVFEGDFRNYYTKPGNMRSVDWVCFLLFVVPTMVCDMLELQLGGVEQGKAVVDALVFLVTGCTIALSWKISEDDLVKIESEHVFVEYALPPIYTRNCKVAWTTSLHKCTINGAIHRIYVEFFKKHIKSQKNPGVNAGNILRRHQTCRYYNSLLEDKQELEEDLDDDQPVTAYSINCTDDMLFDDTQLWDHFESSVEDYADINLRLKTLSSEILETKVPSP